jgi:small basic protein
MTEHVVIFFRGLLLMSPAVIIGVLIAAYVPNRVIGYASIAVMLCLIHFAGAMLRRPWRRRP